MSKATNKFISSVCYISIFLTLLFFSGFYFFEEFSFYGKIIITCILSFTFLITNKKINKNIIFIILLLYILILLTNLVTGISFVSIVFMFFTLIDAFLFVTIFGFRDFCVKFINIMILISLVSLVGNTLLIYFPRILDIFPTITNSNGNSGKFLLFSIIYDFSYTGQYRNQGIFWEPGAFQTFLVMAYIINLHYKFRTNRKIMNAIIIIVSLITTMSTTAYVTLLLLLIYTFCIYPQKNKFRNTIILFLVSYVSFLIFWPKIVPIFQYTIITKFEQIFNYVPGISNESSSRMDSIYYVFLEFSKYPIFGLGEVGYESLSKIVGHNMFTCTPINFFANYGIFYGIIISYGIYKFFSRCTKNKVANFYIFIVFLISVSSEEFSNNVFFVIVMLYGLLDSTFINKFKGVKNEKNSVY